MSPPKRKRILRADKIYDTLQQKILRKEILRRKMLEVRTSTNKTQAPNHTFTAKSSSLDRVKTELKTINISSGDKSPSPILLRTKSTDMKPMNFKISFNTTSNDNEKRKIQAIELTRVTAQPHKVKPENSIGNGKKQWPKLVCTMEIAPLTSNDSMLNGAILSPNIDFTSSPPRSSKILIIAPAPSTSPRVLSQSPTLNHFLINNSSPQKIYSKGSLSPEPPLLSQPSLSSVSQQQDTDTFLEPKKRRLILSDSLPPMFKAPFKVPLLDKAPCKAPFRSPVDLRQRISGNLRQFEDDIVSICAYSEIITDEDANVVAENPAAPISPTKKAEILNWVTNTESMQPSSGNSSDLSNTPPFSPDSDFHSETDKSDTIVNSNSDESRTNYNRYDRFQVSFNSIEDRSTVPSEIQVNQLLTKSNQLIVRSNSVETPPQSNITEVASNPLINQLFSPSPEIISSSNNRAERSPSFDRTSSNTSKDSLSYEIRRYGSLSNISNDETSQTEMTPASVLTTDTKPNSLTPASVLTTDFTPNSLTQPTETTSQFKKAKQDTVGLINSQRIPIESSHGNQSQWSSNVDGNQRDFRNSPKEPSFINQNVSIEPTFTNLNQRGFQILHQNIDAYRLRPPPQYQNRGRQSNFIPNKTLPFNGPRMRGPNQLGQSNQNANIRLKQKGTFIRMNSMKLQGPQPLINSFNLVNFDPTRPPPSNNQNDCQGLTSPQQEFVPPKPLMKLKQVTEFMSRICIFHFKFGNCKFGRTCKYNHGCPAELQKNMSALNVRDLRELCQQMCKEKKHNILSEFLDVFVQSYILHKDKIALLELLHPVLQMNNSCSSAVEKILHALSQINVPFKDAILKVLNYVGASNRKLFDILFAIAIEHFTPAANSPSNLDWAAVEQLLEYASHIDFGVFSDLCTKCIDIPPHISPPIMTVLGQILLEDPCKVNVTMIVPRILDKLCSRMEVVGCDRIAADVRRKWGVVEGRASRQIGLQAADQDERMDMDCSFVSGGDLSDDPQLSTISSTISGPNNQNFNSAYLQIPNASVAASITTKSIARNTERTKSNCSPDSSSFPPFNTKLNLSINSTSTISHRHLLPPTSSSTRSIKFPLSRSINSTPSQSTRTSTPFTNNTYEQDADVIDIYTSITKGQFSNAAVFIAKEREEAIEMICKLMLSGSVEVHVAFCFFDCLSDHLTENFHQYIELKGIVLFILFNIYEFLLKENNRGDASYLLIDRFSKDQHAFLHYKTFLPSGQCSPMQKCHKAVKILLEEKMLEACFHWFKLEEYQKVMLTSDINNQTLIEEKAHLIQDFLQLSYRKLDVAFDLVEYCMNSHLSVKIDFKKHYNWILIQMINNTDHKEKVIQLKDRLFNDEYVYLNSQTLRSYVVEFYSHFSLEELLHIYDIISRDEIYPKITGDEHMLNLRETLKENEISIILLNFLHQIVKQRIEVSWDVNIRFHANDTTGPTIQDTQTVAVMYPRNLLMYSTINDAIKRLINVLKSSNCVQNSSTETKWRVSHNSGTVTLLRDHVQAMVRNYKGTQNIYLKKLPKNSSGH